MSESPKPFSIVEESLGGAADAVRAELDAWQEEGRVARLWRRDAGLWTGGDEARWLGWLDLVGGSPDELYIDLVDGVRSAGVQHAVVLGMGGSSLFPDVLRKMFATSEGHPALHVLDSIDPTQIRTLEAAIDLSRTLFIVASKSGSTLEPSALYAYFRARVEALNGQSAGAQFIAVTDPASGLEALATRASFRYIAHGDPSVGGRFSALSGFGLVPAAILGLDVTKMRQLAAEMRAACGPTNRVSDNPGARLGVTLGVLARHGRDKLTLVASPRTASFGAWVEQLVAESTGKVGRGIVPVVDETVGPPAVYGDDRIFVQIRLAGDEVAALDESLDALAAAGHPVVRITLREPLALGAEVFRWEMATAVAGAVLGIHPFDQPDVEAAKVAARRLTDAYRESGALPAESPRFSDGDVAVFGDDAYAAARDLDSAVAALVASILPRDYFAINAFLEMSSEHDRRLQSMRIAVRDARCVATSVGYGPRFLHSTGQLHKGGANNGVFVQITVDHDDDLEVPEMGLTFATIEAAQARGDWQVLAERGRRQLRLHITGDVDAGLDRIGNSFARALRPEQRQH